MRQGPDDQVNVKFTLRLQARDSQATTPLANTPAIRLLVDALNVTALCDPEEGLPTRSQQKQQQQSTCRAADNSKPTVVTVEQHLL